VDEARFLLDLLPFGPAMLAAGFLPRWATVMWVLPALVERGFQRLDPDANIRLGFEALVLRGCALLTSQVLRRRR
jgi:hypothetical protein